MGEPDLSDLIAVQTAQQTALTHIARELGADYGGGIAQWPEGLAPTLKAVREAIAEIPGTMGAGYDLLNTHLCGIAQALYQLAYVHPQDVRDAATAPLATLREAWVPPALARWQETNNWLGGIAGVLSSLQATIWEYGLGGGGAGGVAPEAWQDLLTRLADGSLRIRADAGDGFKPLAIQLPESVEKLLKLLTEKEGDLDTGKVDQTIAQVQNELTGGTFGPLDLFGLTSARVDDGPGNCAKAYGLTATLGLTAAKFWAWLAGVIPINRVAYVFSSLAKISGDLAGYGPVTSTITRAVARPLLQTPMEHWTNREYRPTIPGYGDTMRLYWKRLMPDSPDVLAKHKAPYSAREVLQQHGYADEWIDLLLNDASRELGIREIAGVYLSANMSQEWVKSKFQRQQLPQDDIAALWPLTRWRAVSSTVNSILNEQERQLQRGFISLDTFRASMTELEYPEVLRELRELEASAGAWTWLQQKKLDTLVDSYQGGLLADDSFKDALGEIVVDTSVARQLFLYYQAQRYPKMKLLTPYAEAAEIRGEARRAVILGLLDWNYYEKFLVALGWTDQMLAVEADLVQEERGRQVVADLRTFFLPEKRDSVLEGTLSVAQYDEWLRTILQELPTGSYAKHGVTGLGAGAQRRLDAIRKAEVGYVSVLLARRQRARVERYMIPNVEAAYVQGLVVWQACVTLLREAGYEDREIDARRDILTLQRARNLEVREQAKVRHDRSLVKQAEAELKARQREAAQAAVAIVKAKAALLTSKDPAAAEEAWNLVAELDYAYAAAHELMPDSIYESSMALRDAAGDPAGVDFDYVEGLLGALTLQLERAAGEPEA